MTAEARKGEAEDAWNDVASASKRSGVRIRLLDGLAETARMNDVIERVWGAYPLDDQLMAALEFAGLPAIGAENGEGELVGFAVGFAGIRHGLHYHSHEVAVLSSWQGRGVGRSLKLAQRAWCLEQGIEEIRWTYDPMLVRNARLNISRLGGYGSGLLRDFYGEMSDLQNAGDRSDRFELRWRLLSPRVLGALAEPTTSEPGLEGQVLLQARQDGSPVLVEGHPGERALVKVPADYASLRRTAPDEAATWREVAATAFASCFAAGLVAAAVSKNGEYLFVPRSEVEGTDSLHSP